MSGFLNYTTKVPATRTVSEVQALLGSSGASAVATMYDNGRATGISFVLNTEHGPRTFTLPVDVDGVRSVLRHAKLNGGMSRTVFESAEHAERVAWRVVKDWLEAQLALVAARMAQLDVVMLPYLQIDRDGRTLAQAYREQGALALPAGDA